MNLCIFSGSVREDQRLCELSAAKRSCVPDGNTPGKTKAKRKQREKPEGVRKTLFAEDSSTSMQKSRTVNKWTTEETTALVQHICLYWEDAHNDKWPTTKCNKFWENCAVAVNKVCNSSRTGETDIHLGF